MATYAGITFTEFISDKGGASPKEYWSNQVPTKITRVFDCAWSDRLAFLQALIGYPTAATDGSGKILRQTAMPLTPQYKWLRATAVQSIEGIGPPADPANAAFPTRTMFGSDQYPLYNKARLTVDFTDLMYDVVEDTEISGGDESTLKRNVTILYLPRAQYLTLPQGVMQYVKGSGGMPAASGVTTGLPRLDPSGELNIIHEDVPLVPTACIDGSTLGTVNMAPLVAPSRTYPTGTLLYTAVDYTPRRSVLGNRTWTIRHTFKHYEPGNAADDQMSYGTPGHNWFIRPKGQTPANNYKYALVTTDGTSTGRTVYQASDFSKLFKAI